MPKYKLTEGEARLLVAVFDHLKPYYERSIDMYTSAAYEMNNADGAMLKPYVGLLKGAIAGGLDEQERIVIKWRYGLSADEKCYASEEIAPSFNVKPERIHQIELKALRKIRQYMTELNDEETARTVSELQDRETEYLRSPDANHDQDEMLRDICMHNWEVCISAHRKLKIQQEIRKYRERTE